jgi:voltage-gated potassium channel
MAKSTFDNRLQKFSENRFLILLVLILSTIVLTPFLDDFFRTKILMDIFLTILFFGIIFAIRSKRSHLIIASILVLPLILSTWSIYIYESTHISIFTRIFGALFFGYAVIIILQMIARSTDITRETIFAAVVAYLLIALMWAFLYMILEMVAPGSFSVPDKSIRVETMQFEYFSFITITTLGYGDITPLTNRASALTLLEAIIGQIYLVVLVAWLVGMYVSRKAK